MVRAVLFKRARVLAAFLEAGLHGNILEKHRHHVRRVLLLMLSVSVLASQPLVCRVHGLLWLYPPSRGTGHGITKVQNYIENYLSGIEVYSNKAPVPRCNAKKSSIPPGKPTPDENYHFFRLRKS